MSEWRSINLNDTIRFKLTPLGERIWLDFWRPYSGSEGPRLPRKDGDWFVDQLWEVAHIFGSHMLNGGSVPIETTVQVDIAP